MQGDLPPVLLLAGGAGTRAGGPKGLVEQDGVTWLERQLASLAAAGVMRVVVVLGHGAPSYLARLPWLAAARERWVEPRAGGPLPLGCPTLAMVTNERPELGQFASLQVGARWLLEQGADAAFVQPVDVPVASREVFSALRAALDGVVGAAQPAWQGRGGHPVLLAARVLASLLQLDAVEPRARLDVQLRALAPGELLRLQVSDERVVANLNTRAELAASLALVKP